MISVCASWKDRAMKFRRQSFTERRRHQLARKVDQLDRFESRNMITESLGIMMLGVGVPAVAAIVRRDSASEHADGPRQRAQVAHRDVLSFAAIPVRRAPRGSGGEATKNRGRTVETGPVAHSSSDWLTLRAPQVTDELPAGTGAARMQEFLKKAARRTGGGAAAQPRGGTAAPPPAPRGAITPLQISAPSQGGASSASLNALGASLSGASTISSRSGQSPASLTAGTGTSSRTFQTTSGGGTVVVTPTNMAPSGGSSLTSAPYGVTGNSSGASQGSFPYFPLYVLDYNQGQVIFPNTLKQGTRGGNVDLRAQISGTTLSSISWDTSGLGTDVTGITGASTYNLKFQWGWIGAAHTDTVSVTVTNTLGQAETEMFSFALPAQQFGFGPGTGTATWPTSLSPDTTLASDVSFPGGPYASVNSNSGAVDTDITLPTYNPNLAPIAVTYDSLTADARPIVVFPHQIDPSNGTVPTKVSAQLTFNGTAGTTWYYNTSSYIPGNIQQIALQANATSLATGRYAYTGTIADVRGTNTTFTISGNTDVINYSGGAIGNGWTVAGLEQITTATGGVIVDLGTGGKSLWFAGSPPSGGNYTSPAGEFSTLTFNSGGTYTRTLTDGTQINFNSSGQETSIVDTNNFRTTLAYTSGRLSTITDRYGKLVTFAYDVNNKLSTITDPAGRITTFTHTSGNLTGVTMPDSSTWGYAYDGSNRLTQITDQRSKVTTVAYDSAERVSTITLADSTTQKFSAYQEQGWTNNGTSGSPATATLLAAAPASFTDQRGNVSQVRPDWNGEGLPNVTTDTLGNITSFDRDANGLPTVVADRINRISSFTYDNKGNISALSNPDATTESFTYNSFAETLTATDENSHTYTYTYDSGGNLTVVRDPLNNLTTMTYTGDGMVATLKNANGKTTSYAYDSQDRLTTVTLPDNSTQLYAYDSKGNATTYTDENGNVTVFRFDALNRTIGITDALNNLSSFTYDSGGNLTVDQEPLSRTTSYAFDSMSRLTTITDPLTHVTKLGYDADGNRTTITDPLNRVTSIQYDAENRPTVVIDPMTKSTTTVYDAEGQAIVVTDPMGRVTTTTYSVRGWQATVTDGLSNVVTYAYTATGHPSTVSNPDSLGNNEAFYVYNADDKVTQFTDGLNHTTSYTYDGDLNVATVTDGNGHTTSYAYDSRDRLTTVTDALTHTTVYGYDNNSNQTTVTDGLGHTTATAYDALNRATTVTDALSNRTVTSFDAVGRVQSVVDPSGNRTTYGYDSADNVTTLTTPIGTTTYVYDPANELTDQTDANGRRTTFAYDSDGRQTNERWLTSSGGTVETLTYTYDFHGELTGAIDPNAALTFTYDSGGNQITARTSSTGGQPNVLLTSGFDANHHRTTLADNLTSAGLTTYTFDLALRLTQESQSFGGTSGPQVAFSYDAASNLTSLSRTIGGGGTQVNTTLSYDVANRVTTIVHSTHTSGFGGGTTTPIVTFVYSYDSANRVTTEIDSPGPFTFSYSYDNANELTGVSGARAETYTYDSGGNRTMTGYSTGSDNELTASPGATYTYDAEGNMTGKTETSGGNVWTYTWDYRNRLTSVLEKNSGGTVIFQATYTYDPLNRRIGTNVDDDGSGPHAAAQTWMVYDGLEPYAQYSGAGTLQQRYLFGPAIDEVFARTNSGGTTAWYLTDDLGSVRNLVDVSGNFLDTITYDSFGSVLTESSSPNGDQFKFAGVPLDGPAALYFVNARYYSQTIGRFVSQDPVSFAAGDPNVYRYTANGPTNATDTTGEDSTVTPLGDGIFRLETGGVLPTSGVFMPNSLPPLDLTPLRQILIYASPKLSQPLATQSFIPRDFIPKEMSIAVIPWGPPNLGVGVGMGNVFVIGRQVDTAVARGWPGHTVLHLPRKLWNLEKNDAWIREIIKQKAPVYIASPVNRGTLWDKALGRERVLARELRQLVKGGYRRFGDWMLPRGGPPRGPAGGGM
jgi:RHS repeat-associated protein